MDVHTPYVTKIMNKTRTAGDGMECSETNSESAQKSDSNPRSGTSISKSTPLLGRLVQVYPKNIIRTEIRKPQIHSKSTKFVPYEPYAAAVKPITQQSTSIRVKKSRNNMDINTLISQMSQMNTELNEFKPRQKSLSSDKPSESDREFPEKEEMVKQIGELQRENETLNNQLKQQVQVNKELKTMLVASMGEDLETQVHCLNEDKKHLANALLNSAQHLSTHQEQTEWLAGQCEVWRSKFLASSLMVEELANCKKVLNNKTEKLQQAIKQLLDERCRARDMMLSTYRNLYSLHEEFLQNIAISEYTGSSKFYNRPIGNLNFNVTMPHSTNILDMASVNLKLSENISSSVDKQDIRHLDSLYMVTEGEKFAENVMALPLDIRRLSEEPMNALVHHAYNSSSTTGKPVASCVHCTGRVQLL